MSMATMNIKDPEVHAAASELAERRGISLTEAVRQAVAEALASDRQKRADFFETVKDIQRRAALSDEPYLTDDDLYDERGLPR